MEEDDKRQVTVQQADFKRLKSDITAHIDIDGDGFIVQKHGLPVYGYGDNIASAIGMFVDEVQSLFDDLSGDDTLYGHWIEIRDILGIFIEGK